MGFSGGTYTRTDGVRSGTDVHVQQKNASIKVLASLTDTEMNDVATALSTCLLKDGTQTVTANLPMNGKKLTGLADGSARTDSATIANVQDNAVTFVATTGGTADAQTITLSPAITSYNTGLAIEFLASATNTTAMTLNVNGLGAKNLFLSQTGAACKAGNVTSGRTYRVIYDGTQFQLLNPTHVWTTYSGVTITQSGSVTFTVGTSTYKIIDNDTVVWDFILNVTGSGTVANIVTLSLPVTAAAAADYKTAGAGVILDTSAGFAYACSCVLNTTTTVSFFTGSGTTANYFGISPAVALASGDKISGTITYKI